MESSMLSGSQTPLSFRKQHDYLQGEIVALSAVLSPLRKLAVELIAQIFELCLPIRALRDSAFRANEAPLLVAQINRDWRQVALSTPRLWTRMSICLPLGRLPSPVWTTAIAQASFASLLWLSRAGNQNLHVAVQYVRSDENNESDQSSRLWLPAATELVTRLLRRHGSHIEALSFFLPVPCVSPLLRANCPLMRKLTITDNGQWRPGGYQAHLQVVPNGIHLPGQLRQLILDTPAFDLQWARYPWNQLTLLYLRHQHPISLVDACNVLRMCHRLYTFMLAIGSPVGMVEQLVVHSLRELWLYGSPDGSGAFLDVISTPRLKKLVIGDSYNHGSLLDFLQNLSGTLLSLRFHRIFNMPEDDLFDILQLAPSLVELDTVSTAHNLILEMLTPENNFVPLCPRLESLSIRLHLANEQLIELLEARCGTAFRAQGVAQLKKAHFTFMDSDQRNETWEWDNDAWMQKVEQWRHEGVNLHVEDFDWDNSEGWDGTFEVVFGG